MTVHLLHPQWQVTYCGRDLRTVHVTTTNMLVTCSTCWSNRCLIEAIHSAEPDQFAETREDQ